MLGKPLHECRVLVTPTSFGQSDPRLRAALEKQVGEVRYNPDQRSLKSHELRPLVQDVNGFIAGLDDIDAAVIEAAGCLKIIERYGWASIDLPSMGDQVHLPID